MSVACHGCAAREREIHRLRARSRLDFEEIDDLQSDNRALRRAIHRLWLRLEALTPEEPPCPSTPQQSGS